MLTMIKKPIYQAIVEISALCPVPGRQTAQLVKVTEAAKRSTRYEWSFTAQNLKKHVLVDARAGQNDTNSASRHG